MAVVGVLFGGLAVILAVPFTSAFATLIDVLVLGHDPPAAQPRRPRPAPSLAMSTAARATVRNSTRAPL